MKVEIASKRDAQWWADQINETANIGAMVGAVLAVGKKCAEAREALREQHGEWERMFRDGADSVDRPVPFSKSTANKLIQVIENTVLKNGAHVSRLPPAWGTLYELSRVPEPILEKAIKKGLIHPDMERKDVKALLPKKTLKDVPPPPKGTFRVIYADPPWSYSNSGFEQSAASQYPTMTTEAIAAMTVPAAPDSVLFLWATVPLLPDAFTVMTAWGFTYKSGFVWVKNRAPGIGWFLNTKHEHLLIGVRGEIGHPQVKPDSVVEHDVRAHSQKPDVFYDIIAGMYGEPTETSHLELFARRTHKGWKSWGNEV